MKFTMTKKHLADALVKMKNVATKGIMSEYELAFRTTLKVENSVVKFLSSNGSLNAIWEVTNVTDSNLKCESDGFVTVDSTIAVGTVSAIGKDDSVLEFELDGDTVTIRDLYAKSKKKIKLQTLAKGHSFVIKKPSTGFNFSISAEDFKKNIVNLSSYALLLSYQNVSYQMVCMHFLAQENRFICGDGTRFGIIVNKLTQPNKQISDEKGKKFLMPADQAAVINSILDSASSVDIIFKDESTYYIKPLNAMEIELKGIPKDEYVAYESHAFCAHKARIVVDVKVGDLREAMNIVSSVRDKEKEAYNTFHHAKFQVNYDKKTLDLIVDEQKYECEVECPADIYYIQGEKTYNAMYAAAHLNDVVSASNKKPMVRFHCVDESRTIVVEPVDAGDDKNSSGVPIAKNPDDSQFLLFFTGIVEEND